MNENMPVTKFMMDRENRLAVEAGESAPYPYTEAGYKKFLEDFSKTPAMKAYIKKHNLTKSPLNSRFVFGSKHSSGSPQEDWICIKSGSKGFDSDLFKNKQEQKYQEQEQKKPKGWFSSLFDL